MKLQALLLLAGIFLFTSFNLQTVPWQELEKGLTYATIPSPVKSSIGDSKIEVLRINPKYFKFNLLAAGEKKCDSKTAKAWGDEYKMIACVNSSMFQLESPFNKSTGYMKNYKYVNNGSLNSKYRNVFAFNSNDTSLSDAHIIDLSCENWEQLKTKYNSFSQSLRMLDCDMNNTWQLQEKKWSMVLLGEDKDKNILFIFVRSPYRVKDYINILLDLPLNLKRLMYLEGGPEASFYVNHSKLKVEKFGSYETGFNENDKNASFWNIPNVIAISRK
ncbi:MAG: phosphodiester glycosidase family protein [Cytophagaceae bacterium]|nr:phosphodiester glycosidase family protein [Cytophagaceae bacterium]